MIRLVGAVFPHRLGKGDTRPRRGRHLPAAREFLEDAADHRLHRGEHVLLLDEAHFDVELIELARQAIGARVFVAKAGRDLKIAVEARHHQKLLILLRRLRQRVEAPGMNARGNEEIARAFRARRGQDRRLEFVEALPFHPSAQTVDDTAAQHDVAMELLAPKIEEAVSEPCILGIGLVAEYRQGQIAGRAEHFDVADIDLHAPRRHFRVLRAGRALAHRPVDPNDRLRTQLLGLGEGRRIRIDHALGDAVMVAQIDEQHAAMIADAMAPAGKPDLGALTRFARAPQVCVRYRCMGQISRNTKPGAARRKRVPGKEPRAASALRGAFMGQVSDLCWRRRGGAALDGGRLDPVV